MHAERVHIKLSEIALGSLKNKIKYFFCAYILAFYYFFITFVIGTVLYSICPLGVLGCGELVLTTLSEAYSRPRQTTMELFAKIINDFFLLAISVKKNHHLTSS